MMRLVLGLVLILSLLGQAGCYSQGDHAPAAARCEPDLPEDSVSEVAGMTLALTPETLKPGHQVTSSIRDAPEDGLRGQCAYLECWNGQHWETLSILFAGYGEHQPYVRPFPLPDGMAMEDMGFNARVTLPFVMPDTLKPGAYRMRQTVAFTVNGFAEATEVTGALRVIR